MPDEAAVPGVSETPAATPNATPEPVSTPAPSPVETPVETPVEGTPQDQPADGTPVEGQPAADAGLELVEDEYDIKPDKVEGKQFFFREPKAKKLLADHEFVRSLDGVIPGATVETIQQHYNRSLGAQQMLDDFTSGQPEQVGRWLEFHVGPNTNPQSVALMASGLMQKLPEVAPQVYGHIKNEIVGNEVQSMYEKAISSGNEKLLTLAQNLDFHLTGRFKTAEDLQQRDPWAAERDRFEREKQAFYGERESAQRQWLDTQMAQADEQVEQAKMQEIEAALTPAANLKGKPQWGYMLHELAQKVEEARKSNPGWQREYDILRQRVKQSPSAESKAALADMMRTFVKRAVAPHRKAVIDAVAQPILSASAQATQKAQTAAGKQELAGGAAATNPTADLSRRAKELLAKGASPEEIMALAR